MPNKTKIHTVYKNAQGQRLPSVTTVLNILSKPALLEWAWKLGTEGLDYKAVRDSAGDIGTLTHYLILCHLKNEKPDITEYSIQDIDKAETCLIKFYDWLAQNPIEPILLEQPLISEEYQYGGTVDCFAKRKDTEEIILLDFKTGKAIYAEHFYQLSAYENLLAEHKYSFDKSMILRIGKDETEDLEIRETGKLDKHFEIFRHCLEIYKLQKDLK